MATISLGNGNNNFTDSNAGNRILGQGGNDTIFGREEMIALRAMKEMTSYMAKTAI